MKLYKNIFFLFIIFLFILFISGCLKDTITPPFSVDLESSAELLTYLEGNGDYINSSQTPSLIEASEVYSNLNKFLILDVRDESEFNSGHIENALNPKPKDLLIIFDSLQNSSYEKIILVSASGQSAAYYTSLLRLNGNDKVFSMNFGMAAWNNDFADEWLNENKTLSNLNNFDDVDYPKAPYTNLPILTFEKSGAAIEEKLKERISKLLLERFDEKRIFLSNTSVSFENIIDAPTSNNYLICYGIPRLYVTRDIGIVHPVNCIFYNADPVFNDLRSIKYLQTIPTDKPVLIYSYNGQLSAYVAAYLRLLGYDSKSVLFGASNVIYDFMKAHPILSTYLFTQDRIMNYPYITN